MKNASLDKSKYIKNLSDNLPVFRAKLELTQEELGEKIGVSRSTIALIENKKRDMTWNTFLSLVYLFSKNGTTKQLMEIFEIYTRELEEYLF